MVTHSVLLKYSLISIGSLGAIAALTITAALQEPTDTIPNGVHVAEMDWSGKSLADARAALTEWATQRASDRITLTLAPESATNRNWTPTRTQLGASADFDATIVKIREAVNGASVVEKVGELVGSRKEYTVAPVWKIDPNLCSRYLKRTVAPRVNQPKRDARLIVLKQGFKKVPERSGVGLDIQATCDNVAQHIGDPEPTTIPLVTRVVAPRVTMADASAIEGLVAQYSTHFSERGNRAQNIITACNHINGLVLKPGDRFSYNEVVGPREAEAGFKLAPVIIRGKLEPGMGGGICQVSSTLYNAALYGDFKILTRSHHAFPVHYLPAGRDATVAYGSIDFRFENNTGSPVAISASGSGGRVVMRIFGKPVPGKSVRIDRVEHKTWGAGVQIVRDPTLPAGKTKTIDKGHAGHSVTVTRTVYMYGVKQRREVISNDTYRAFPRITAVGAGAPLPHNPAPGPSATPVPLVTVPGG